VLRMPTIFSAATTTLVWLGPADNCQITVGLELAGLMFDAGESIAAETFQSLSEQSQAALAITVSEISRLDYWKRVWVVQEIVYSKTALLMYGNSIMSYSYFVGS
jgi:heterokaryon incompatibility protein (HET)